MNLSINDQQIATMKVILDPNGENKIELIEFEAILKRHLESPSY